jgi:hypothetical protein
MAETCGGIGFRGTNFAPKKNNTFNPMKYFEKRQAHKQQVKIDNLETKSKTDGLTNSEKLDLLVNKLDVALKDGITPPVVYYKA